ncbi:unnamed protein product [Urochloa decumbens]|uniref:Uncharacterized protein n=1 Tax=Urochloa decumbens TaxID=240449 RepID=A0ABC8VV70_9POAL
MDAWEATKVVFERLRALDPDNASKMMGMLLVQDNSDKELIRLAFGPDHLLHAFVAAAHAELAAKPASLPSPPVLSSPWRGCGDYDGGAPSPGGGAKHQPPFAGDVFYPENEYGCLSPASGGHRRSLSLSDAEASAWRPCVYFARGYCKNGSSCRFLHDDLPVLDDSTAVAAATVEQEMAVMRTKALAAARMASACPFSPSPRPKGVSLNFLLHQQQHEHSQRAAAAMVHGGEDMHRFPARSPRITEHGGDLVGSPAARQIYLTFPADSTFTEKDVSNYFSMYGPVQDVRIPYQQKRMFGFVTFVYEESVRIILNKGNPHFVCNSRVLVKPYKDKAKVPDMFRKLQHGHHGDFACCTSPTGLLDSRAPFDLQRTQIGPRMMHGNIAKRETFLRRKLEAQQQAGELQQAVELEGQRFVRLQLVDLESRGYRIGSPIPLGQADGKGSINGNGNAVHMEDVTIQGNKKNNSEIAMSVPAAAALSTTGAEGKHEEQQEEDVDASPKQMVNPRKEDKRESGPMIAMPNVACEFQESGLVEHILPESPFASPTKASIDTSTIAQNVDIDNSSPYHVASSLFPPTSTPDLRPYNCCFFQVPRFSPGHEAIGQ